MMLYQYRHFGVSNYFCKEYGKNFAFPKHIHHSYEFITVLSVRMDVCVGKRRYTLSKGEGVLVFPHQLHSPESTQSEHLLVIFSPDIIRAYHAMHRDTYPKDEKNHASRLSSFTACGMRHGSISRKNEGGALQPVCVLG